MESSKNGNNDSFGVKITRKRKGNFHHINYADLLATRQQLLHPPIHNISKEEFKDFVQQHTRSQSRDLPPRPIYNPPKRQNSRLNKMRPPALPHIQRPLVLETPPQAPYNNNVALPTSAPFSQASPSLLQLPIPGNMTWSNPIESPISAYVRCFQNAMTDTDSLGIQAQHQSQPHPSQPQGSCNVKPHHPLSSSTLPIPLVSMLHSSTSDGLNVPVNVIGYPYVAPSTNDATHPPIPSMNLGTYSPLHTRYGATNPHVPNVNASSNPPVPALYVSPHPSATAHVANPFVPSIPSPQTNSLPMLPSPTFQFPFPSSPTDYMNLISPQSYYPLLSPGTQFPFSFTYFP